MKGIQCGTYWTQFLYISLFYPEYREIRRKTAEL